MPEINKTDRISNIQKIVVPKSNGFRTSSYHAAGFKYKTDKNYKFSTSSDKALRDEYVRLTVSPLFKSVKTVKANKGLIDFASGCNA